MKRDSGRLGRVLGLALLAFGAAAWLAAPAALAQDLEAEQAEPADAEEAEPADEAIEAEEAGESPEREVPSEGEADDAGPDDEEAESAVPEETDDDAPGSPASVEEDADDEAKWRERHRQMQKAVQTNEARLADAESQRSKLGDRYSYGGRSRKAIVSELDNALRALQRAQRDLDRFYEEARVADVPPGWVREDD